MKKLCSLILFLLLVLAGFAQPDKAKMENERKAIQKELKEIQTVYNQVKGQKKETIGQLNLLQKKMSLQGKYIGNINKEINLITNDIYTSTLEVNKLQRQLDTLKQQYARSVVYAYKNRSNYDYLNFIFSASTFNDALKRVSYLRSYRNYRQQQVANIIETQKAIEDRKQQLLGKKTQKSSALDNQKEQLNELEEQKKEKDAVVAKLKSKESDLAKQIAMRKKKDAQLKNNIAAIIRREIEERRRAEKAEADRLAALEKARAKETTTTTTGTTTTKTTVKAPVKKATPSAIPLNEKEVALSSSFAANKGKLPWPVDNGYVSARFGTNTVPGTSLTFDNPGITISTPSAGVAVKAVFDGEVLSVFDMGDGTSGVTVSHGKYFTTYSNITGVSVGKGSVVRTGQTLGRTGNDDDGAGGKLEFVMVVEYKNVNPSPWLRH